MVKIVTDLPIAMICSPDVEINPLKNGSTPIQSQQYPKLCLSLIVLLIPYGYLLYRHILSLCILHSKNLKHQLDPIDAIITILSILRLGVLFLILIIDHESTMTMMGVLGFFWQFSLMLIYISFFVENRRTWGYVVSATCTLYVVYTCIYNYLKKQNSLQAQTQHRLLIPIFYSNILITLVMSVLGIKQFISIENALLERILTPSITIQLKNRRSFIFLTLLTCWISLLMRRFPQVFMPILGVVLYFILSQLVNIAVVYKCILSRIVKCNQQEQSEQDDEQGIQAGLNRRKSNMIIVQMQNYAKT